MHSGSAVRDVPEDVRQALAERARARGQSLQAFLLALVQDEARRSTNLSLLGRFDDRDDGSRLSPGQATEALDTARAGRDRPLAGQITSPDGAA
jgi:antitoxin FitA